MMDISYKVHNVKFEYFDKSWYIFEDTQEMQWNTEYGSDNGTYWFLALPSVISYRNKHPV